MMQSCTVATQTGLAVYMGTMVSFEETSINEEYLGQYICELLLRLGNLRQALSHRVSRPQ